MLLQTYLYNYCAALASGVGNSPLPVLLYGVERIQCLCESWMRYFAPTMFQSIIAGSRTAKMAAWDDVMETADYLNVLLARSRELLSYAPQGNNSGALRRLAEIQFLLSEQVLKRMYDLKYYSANEGQLCVFTNTNKIITSFVPFETCDTPAMAPAAYGAEEKLIIEQYLRTLRNAPSVTKAAGVESGEDMLPFMWSERCALPGGYATTSLESRFVFDKPRAPSTYVEILHLWAKELSQCSQT